MILDFARLSAKERYLHTIQALIPRPIAWALTENEGGDFNLAPFSFFTAVCSEPPILMLSVGKKPDGSLKDTRLNLEARGECVIHIPSRHGLAAMNASSATLAHGVSEVTDQGLTLSTFDGFRLPRLADAHVAFGCRLHEIQEIGAGPQSLLFVEVQRLFIDDAILEARDDGRIKVDTQKLDPVARLGANEYAFLHDISHLKRPD
jgi:flavin reductase (DIM6/NTAB) family NADH-FMN oxidoreductase RutF